MPGNAGGKREFGQRMGHVSRTAHRKAALIKHIRAKDRDHGRTDTRQVDRRRQRGSAEDQVTLTRIQFAVPRRVSLEGTDQQVVEAIAVHVTRAAHGSAALIARLRAEDRDPERTEIGQVDRRRQRCPSEDDVTLTRIPPFLISYPFCSCFTLSLVSFKRRSICLASVSSLSPERLIWMEPLSLVREPDQMANATNKTRSTSRKISLATIFNKLYYPVMSYQ